MCFYRVQPETLNPTPLPQKLFHLFIEGVGGGDVTKLRIRNTPLTIVLAYTKQILKSISCVLNLLMWTLLFA